MNNILSGEFTTIQDMCAAYVNLKNEYNNKAEMNRLKVNKLKKTLEKLENKINSERENSPVWFSIVQTLIQALQTNYPDYVFRSYGPCGLDNEIVITCWLKSEYDKPSDGDDDKSMNLLLIPRFKYDEETGKMINVEFMIKTAEYEDDRFDPNTIGAINRLDRKTIPLSVKSISDFKDLLIKQGH